MRFDDIRRYNVRRPRCTFSWNIFMQILTYFSYITYVDSTQTFIMTDLSISCFEWKIWLYDIFDDEKKVHVNTKYHALHGRFVPKVTYLFLVERQHVFESRTASRKSSSIFVIERRNKKKRKIRRSSRKESVRWNRWQRKGATNSIVYDSEFLVAVPLWSIACCFMGCVMTPYGVWQSPEET